MSAKSVIFTGGEPLLNPDLFRIAEKAREMGFDTVLITNGTLINRDNAISISRSFSAISVSLDSVVDKELERIWQVSDINVSNILANLVFLKELLNEEQTFGIKPVVTRYNIENLPRLTETVLEKLGDVNWDISFAEPTKDISLWEKISVAAEDQKKCFNEAYRNISCRKWKSCQSLDRNKVALHEEAEVMFESRNRRVKFGTQGIGLCGAAGDYILVGSSGDVYPCQSMEFDEFCGGNIREKTLKDIIMKSEPFKKLRSRTIFDIENCSQCGFQFVCSNHCMALSYLLYGDIKSHPKSYNFQARDKDYRCTSRALDMIYYSATNNLQVEFSEYT